MQRAVDGEAVRVEQVRRGARRERRRRAARLGVRERQEGVLLERHELADDVDELLAHDELQLAHVGVALDAVDEQRRQACGARNERPSDDDERANLRACAA